MSDNNQPLTPIPAAPPVNVKVMAYQRAHIKKKLSELENDLLNPDLPENEQLITKAELQLALEELRNWVITLLRNNGVEIPEGDLEE